MGARSEKGNLIKKPWKLATTCDDLITEFEDLVCDQAFRDSLSPEQCMEHSNHELLEGGKRVMQSAFYPHTMAVKAHAVFNRHFDEVNEYTKIADTAAPAIETGH